MTKTTFTLFSFYFSLRIKHRMQHVLILFSSSYSTRFLFISCSTLWIKLRFAAIWYLLNNKTSFISPSKEKHIHTESCYDLSQSAHSFPQVLLLFLQSKWKWKRRGAKKILHNKKELAWRAKVAKIVVEDLIMVCVHT